MGNKELLKRAADAIDDLFGDTSVSKEKAIQNLVELAGQVNDMICVLGEELSTE